MFVILALIKKIWWSTVCAFLHDKNSEVISSPVNHWAQISKDQCHTKSIFRSQIKWFANLWFKMKCSPESRTVSVLDLRVLISHMNIVKLPLPVSVVGYLQSRLDLKEQVICELTIQLQALSNFCEPLLRSSHFWGQVYKHFDTVLTQFIKLSTLAKKLRSLLVIFFHTNLMHSKYSAKEKHTKLENFVDDCK